MRDGSRNRRYLLERSAALIPESALKADLQRAIWALERLPRARRFGAAAIPEQPFDADLLARSPLYRLSRAKYRALNGKFIASLNSSARSLGSSALLETTIEYSPVARELHWAAVRRSGPAAKDFDLLLLRGFVTSVFHEQNHRILWRHLPPAPIAAASLRRYLNFAESLVITLDMALADELEPKLARSFYLTGTIYDPGSTARRACETRRKYRNYLQAALHATYLLLEGYAPRRIPKAIGALFPFDRTLAERAAIRAGNLNAEFIIETNGVWQHRHRGTVRERLGSPAKKGIPLELAADPLNNREQYVLGERIFDEFGV